MAAVNRLFVHKPPLPPQIKRAKYLAFADWWWRCQSYHTYAALCTEPPPLPTTENALVLPLLLKGG